MPTYKSWNQENFRYRLRASLKAQCLNQTELAKRLRVAPATVSRWQSNRANYPSLDNLEAMAQILKVPVCWLAFNCRRHLPKKCERMLTRIEKEMRARRPIEFMENE
jgi:transcriptional regulator with XRE-family HTH domain